MFPFHFLYCQEVVVRGIGNPALVTYWIENYITIKLRLANHQNQESKHPIFYRVNGLHCLCK